jgi:hypothetical protein
MVLFEIPCDVAKWMSGSLLCDSFSTATGDSNVGTTPKGIAPILT